MLVPSVGGVGQDQLQPGGQPSQYGWRGYPWHCSSVTKWPHKPVTLPNMSMLKKTWNVNSGCQASISVHICWTTVFYIRGNVKRYVFSCFGIVYISCHTNILFWVYQTQMQTSTIQLSAGLSCINNESQMGGISWTYPSTDPILTGAKLNCGSMAICSIVNIEYHF